MWDAGRSWQRVALEEVELEVRLGVREAEHERPQRILVTVALFRHDEGYRGGGLDACLDYGRLFRHLGGTLPARPHTALLEELIEDLVGLCFEDPRVGACRVAIRKPEAYGGRAIPCVEAFRIRPPPPPARTEP